MNSQRKTSPLVAVSLSCVCCCSSVFHSNYEKHKRVSNTGQQLRTCNIAIEGCSPQSTGGEREHVPGKRVGENLLIYIPSRTLTTPHGATTRDPGGVGTTHTQPLPHAKQGSSSRHTRKKTTNENLHRDAHVSSLLRLVLFF